MGNVRNLAFWVVLMLLVLALFNLFSGPGGNLQSNEITYSEFVDAVESGEVRSVTLDGEQVRFRKTDGGDYVAIKQEDAEITTLLIENNVPVQARPQQQSGFQTFLMSLLPILLLIGVWIYFMNRMQGGGKGDQEVGFLFNHFSDYSVLKMNNYFENHIAVWNSTLGEYARWNSTTNDYTNVLTKNDINFPSVRDVNVISVLVGYSPVTPSANIVYPPIGPYKTGLIRLFDPTVAADRTAWSAAYNKLTNGCDVCVRVVQGGAEKFYMLPLSEDTSLDPLNQNSFFTVAINLPASAGTVTEVEMISTPNAETDGLPASPANLDLWVEPVPAASN